MPLNSDQTIQALLSRREFARARELIDKNLEQSPNSADAHYLLGVLHYFQGQVPQAIASLQKSLDLDPRHTDTAICLSVLFNDIGKYEEAKQVFELANRSVSQRRKSDGLGVDKKFAIKHLEIADLYFRYRRHEEAIEEYRKAAALNGDEPEIRIRLAKAYAKRGLITRALQELQQLKSENPKLIAARIQLGLLHYSQSNVLDAELEWEGALEIDPGNLEARSYLEMAKYARVRPSPEAPRSKT